MVAMGRAILYGIGVWLIPFVAAFAIFPLRESWRSLFESIMPVTVCTAAIVFGLLYLRWVQRDIRSEMLKLGLVWLAISVAIDLPLMLTGPMKMPPVEYVADIGVTYLIIPAVTVAIGLAASHGR